ncbi:C39 family peptidase [Candidatus Epulonipiscium viviparus]|uniref:C39 family peptidase n=1 Tax=Candidatus Epulonipiscium viviparus TaxID=420336 RepID=UPI00016C0207|nr:C39 family peptidase [Candidatus Epulopiscium viviparus]
MKILRNFMLTLIIINCALIWYLTEILSLEDVMVIHNIFNEVPSFHQILTQPVTETAMKNYSVMQGNTNLGEYSNLQLAIDNTKTKSRAIVIDNSTGVWVHNTFEPYIILNNSQVLDFKNFNSAYAYAIKNNKNRIYYKGNEKIIWENNFSFEKDVYLTVPHIKQMPELPRGCEVTSLAMVLNYNDIDVDKMHLALEIKKDLTQFKKNENGTVFFGNPNDGFVGDMYSFKNHGLGVYHEPIFDLAYSYVGDSAINLTDTNFELVLQFITRGYPVWVIANTDFKKLPNSDFEVWDTPTGQVAITYKMHSVVITGFNDNYIYINDPLSSFANRRINLKNFKESWEQMGSQAIVILEQ